MSTYISLLRGINVGGQKRLSMDSLQRLYIGLGFTAVRTYVQSGNVVFQTNDDDPPAVAKRIEQRIEADYGFPVAVFIRQPQDFRRILANNPFLNDRHADHSQLYVTFLYQPPPEAAWERTSAPAGIPDEFARGDMEIYIFCPNGYGKTKISNDFFERKLGVPATTRNWNTVKTLNQMAEE
jgi:uncharacterized protein (DUF1697 family)